MALVQASAELGGLMRAHAVSIVVPTCGRSASLRRLLGALAHQEGAPPFEVIVVADGVRAVDTGAGDTRAWPFDLRVIEQPRSGAAAARNRGVSAASGRVLLFLDDDVEPCARVVALHEAFHVEQPRDIGAGELKPRSTISGFIGAAICGWWDVMNEALADPRHRFSFRDLLTGHCSMSRATFEEVGGFDVALRCHEDFDFGYRAIERGIDIRFVAGAHAVHHDASDVRAILRRKFDEGFASVQLARKNAGMLRALPLGRPLAHGRSARVAYRLGLVGGVRGRIATLALQSVLTMTERLSMRDKWRIALDRLMDYAYWRGATTAAGGAVEIETLRAAVPTPASPRVTIDLAHGLDAAERELDVLRPRAAMLVVEGAVIGEIAEIAGAEPLRGVHLRPMLLRILAMETAAAMMRAGRLPPLLADAAARWAGSDQSRADTGRAA